MLNRHPGWFKLSKIRVKSTLSKESASISDVEYLVVTVLVEIFGLISISSLLNNGR